VFCRTGNDGRRRAGDDNDEVSSRPFACSSVDRANNFVGNDVAYPGAARPGDNACSRTKAMIPLDGKIREGVAARPRLARDSAIVERDSRFDISGRGTSSAAGLRRRTGYKHSDHRYFSVFARWLGVFLVPPRPGPAFELYGAFANLPMAALFALSLSGQHVVLRGWWSAASRDFARCGPQSAPSTTRTSGCTSASGRCLHWSISAPSTAPRQERDGG